jgi:hypothetical protein
LDPSKDLEAGLKKDWWLYAMKWAKNLYVKNHLGRGYLLAAAIVEPLGSFATTSSS